ncbi:Methylphloroacetophenone synthase [Purpureocillium lavendulum]|uniref:Methylphloroacetophenone synthase n=1 Tax=Purpureocillium lavendulum TaxID=1247861 RepID=A0AB34FRR7_9HYPO|nr:Methylphloroacetophenone synthase [Purpureocillium lavendulum]
MEWLLKHLEEAKLQHERDEEPYLRIGCNLGWMKLDQYYALTEDSPAYLASLVLHPAFRWSTVESQWSDHPDWLTRGRTAVQELWEEYRRSRDEEEIGMYGALAVRLAFAIGAYVDLDSLQNGHYSCLASYISVLRDENGATITVPSARISAVLMDLAAEGITANDTGLRGRYHTKSHQGIPEKVVASCREHGPVCFGKQQIVRSNGDGDIFPYGDTVMGALCDILVRSSNWYSTISKAALRLPKVDKSPFILVIGSDAMPLSVSRSVKIVRLGLPGLKVPPPKGEFKQQYPQHSVAVIGISCKCAGADTIDEFWQLLESGTSMVQPVPPDRWPKELSPRGGSVKTQFWGNFITGIELFDHHFFKKSSREAASMDPQQRLLLQCAYHALESAGYFSSPSRPSDVGCYLGLCATDYDANAASHPPNAFSSLGTLRAFLSGKISHYFNWSGPSITYDTACSSSAVAIHSACRALQADECSLALAGGVALFTSPYLFENLSAAHFLSPTGATRPFDAKADGYCRGEGVGLVVLKKLSAALADGDDILAVIGGSAINQSSGCGPITVPAQESQVALYRKVTDQAGVRPHQVSFVESHGTGTPVGDPIEMESIRAVFGGQHRGSDLIVSSVKGNIGHLEGASGVVGLIKAILQIANRVAVRQASFQSLCPKIPSLGPDRITIPTSNIALTDTFLVACVNNYGAAGSNSALMIMEPPSNSEACRSKKSLLPSKYPIFISGHSVLSVVAYCEVLRDYCYNKADKKLLLGSIAFHLARRQNQDLPYALITEAADIVNLEAGLTRQLTDSTCSVTRRQAGPPLVLVFGGQVRDCVTLSKELWQQSGILRYHLDRCDEILRLMGHRGLYAFIFESSPIGDIVALHTAVFAVQYATARAWLDCGLAVTALVGHSLGYLTALSVSGVLSLEDGLKLVAGRATLMKTHWGEELGAMIAVEADLEALSTISHSLEIACYNGPSSHVLVGDKLAVEEFQYAASQKGIRSKRLGVTHGYHSRFTDPIIPPLIALASGLRYNQGTIPIETCTSNSNETTPLAAQVAQHTRDPVFFGQAIQRLVQKLGACTWLEAGSDTGVMGMIRRALDKSELAQHGFQPMSLGNSASLDNVVDTTLELWRKGHNVQFWNFHVRQSLHYDSLRLPSYQFEKHRHWLELLPPTSAASAVASDAAISTLSQPNQMPALVTLIKQDAGGALFTINPQCHEYQRLVSGHVVAGSPLCPATLYMEIAARACTLITIRSPGHLLEFSNLRIDSPLGLGTDRDVIITLRQLGDRHWDFSITSKVHVQDRVHTTVTSHAQGAVKLQTDSETVGREFARYERLADSEAIDSLYRDPTSESVRGAVLYDLFSRVVEYSDEYRGLRSVAARNGRIAGTVTETVGDATITRPGIVDSFMQVAGIHANSLRPCHPDDVFVFTKLERLQFGPGFESSLAEKTSPSWIIFSNTIPSGSKDLANDIFVFDSISRQIVLLILGAQFSHVRLSSLTRFLSGAKGCGKNTSSSALESDHVVPTRTTEEVSATVQITPPPMLATTRADRDSIMSQVLEIFEKVAEVPCAAVRGDMSVDDLGIDSLMMIEVISELSRAFAVDLPIEDMVTLADVDSLVTYMQRKCGETEGSSAATPDTTLTGPFGSDSVAPTPSSPHSSTLMPLDCEASLHQSPTHEGLAVGRSVPKLEPPPPLTGPTSLQYANLRDLYNTFEEIRYNFDSFSQKEGFANFWSHVYPYQKRLVISYAADAFRKLGADLAAMPAGRTLPRLSVLSKHSHLLERMHEILADGEFICRQRMSCYTRTSKPFDLPAPGVLLQEVVDKFPQHAPEHRLLDLTGSRLAECLVGNIDPLALLFGNMANRQLLADVYDMAPMCRAMTRLLADFLVRAFPPTDNGKTFHLLEVGGGTGKRSMCPRSRVVQNGVKTVLKPSLGGTAKFIVDYLTHSGVPCTYTFTDISPALVGAAKKTLSAYSCVRYATLDAEVPPAADLEGKFHAIISTNCIHATRNATASLENLRRMLRPDDGILALVEFTEGLYWFDLVYGLLDGWWLFTDGRKHALADTGFWERGLQVAGYERVSWTEGDTHESKTLRLICGFNHPAGIAQQDGRLHHVGKRTGIPLETVVWKTVNSLELCADIYYPTQGDDETRRKRPVALLFHGGGHVLFTRKDIHMKHIKELLDRGFLPVSVDYRLCPEVNLAQGPMMDVCDALSWARSTLPYLELARADIHIDTNALAGVGWSSGGHLAMTLAYTANARGIRPPDVVLAFYCPSNFEDEWWTTPTYPKHVKESPNTKYDLLEGVCNEPIARYNPRGAPGAPMSLSDPRWRIIIHYNWKSQILPVLITGLPSNSAAAETGCDFQSLPKPSIEAIRAVSPFAQIVAGAYLTPTFMVHGTCDDLIPWEQSRDTVDALRAAGVAAGLATAEGSGHAFDLWADEDPMQTGWAAVQEGYEFLCRHVF